VSNAAKPYGLPPLDGFAHVHDFAVAHTDSHGITWKKCTGCPAELAFIPDPS
jgi:hypothetical protein